ncbi:hypothetical protein NQ317_009342 [Molorchus minor]|uniref:Tyr recombinase domain-containing protein n=1 Tax=Molorchus minor TaxID=1323400 RepID=A0ABQ9JPY7_9CUCU|nr:hypothetical protein NQ317_009342 [Molorchus minor]
MIKVGLILGIAGACRTDELVNLTVDDIEDVRSSLIPVGKNTMGKIPSVVASYLKLPDVACYTGHCLRRSSATLLADAGVDITTIKRHAGWKSTTVAEGYVENSIENKTKIANQVLVGKYRNKLSKPQLRCFPNSVIPRTVSPMQITAKVGIQYIQTGEYQRCRVSLRGILARQWDEDITSHVNEINRPKGFNQRT